MPKNPNDLTKEETIERAHPKLEVVGVEAASGLFFGDSGEFVIFAVDQQLWRVRVPPGFTHKIYQQVQATLKTEDECPLRESAGVSPKATDPFHSIAPGQYWRYTPDASNPHDATFAGVYRILSREDFWRNIWWGQHIEGDFVSRIRFSKACAGTWEPLDPRSFKDPLRHVQRLMRVTGQPHWDEEGALAVPPALWGAAVGLILTATGMTAAEPRVEIVPLTDGTLTVIWQCDGTMPATLIASVSLVLGVPCWNDGTPGAILTGQDILSRLKETFA